MNLTLEQLKQQLASSQQDVENSRIMLYRAEGMVLVLNHLIQLAETPPDPPQTES